MSMVTPECNTILAVPEAGYRERRQNETLKKAVNDIEEQVIVAFFAGKFGPIRGRMSFGGIRERYLQNKALRSELEPSMQDVYRVLQEQSAEEFKGEAFPGATARNQVFFQESTKYLANPSERAKLLMQCFGDARYLSGEVTIRIPPVGSAENPKLERRLPKVWENLGHCLMATDMVIRSATTLIDDGEWNMRASGLIRALDKKAGHINQNVLISGFNSWIDFFNSFARIESTSYYLRSNESRMLQVQNMMRDVIKEQLLARLIAKTIENPSLVVIKPSVIPGGPERIQMMNTLGQGVETNHVLNDLNYWNNQENTVFWGSEFTGLIDSANYTDVKRRVLMLLKTNPDSLQVHKSVINLLRDSRLILDHQFAGSLVPAIIASAEGKPFEVQVKSLIAASGKNLLKLGGPKE